MEDQGKAVPLRQAQLVLEGRALGRLEELRPRACVGDIRQRGLMVGIELVADRKTKTPFPPEAMNGRKVALAARERGVIIRPLGDVVALMPPLCIGAGELAELTATVEAAIGDAMTDR